MTIAPRKPVMYPTVHAIGTHWIDLMEQITNAQHAIMKASVALAKARPAGRDYYLQGKSAISRAAVQHEQRMDDLKRIWGELQEISVRIYDQQVKREKGKKT